ncbi:MAG: cupin domain-containing protein [Acidobacteriia bacterium]|nr:cupin domain-containing protein [Terriglobia bacterium]
MIKSFQFFQLDWNETSPGITQKGFESDGSRFRLVQYAVDAKHEEWCARGHIGLVLDGEIEFETPEEKLRIKSGEAFEIPEGTPHRAKNVASVPSRFFLAD